MEFQLGSYTDVLPKPDNRSGFVTICDSTLRDGEQAGVKYSLEEKKHIVQMMDRAHIPEVQISSLRNPVTIQEAEVLCGLEREYTKIEIMSRSTAPTWREELINISRIGADIMHTLVPLSHRLRGAYGPALNDEALTARVRDVVSFGKDLGAEVFNLSLLDVTRTEEPLLRRVVEAGVEAGADRICIADTVGCATPEMISALVRLVKSWLPPNVHLRVHVHNDFGLATANALAAAVAGADMIDSCINGRGKRAGNTDTVQIIMGLKAFYHLETGIDLSQLYQICKEIERISGIPIPSNSPFTGELVFADDSEAHIAALQKDHFAFQAIDPSGWGNPRRILIGKNSGEAAVRAKLEQLGLPHEDKDLIASVMNRCLEAYKHLPRGQYLSDEMIRGIYENVSSGKVF